MAKQAVRRGGWARPAWAAQWHCFHGGTSLCGRMYQGEVTDTKSVPGGASCEDCERLGGLKEGWAKPAHAWKWHYFRGGVSLCGTVVTADLTAPLGEFQRADTSCSACHTACLLDPRPPEPLPLDCKSQVGVIVGIVDALMVLAVVLKRMPGAEEAFEAPEVKAALADLRADQDFLWLLYPGGLDE